MITSWGLITCCCSECGGLFSCRFYSYFSSGTAHRTSLPDVCSCVALCVFILPEIVESLDPFAKYVLVFLFLFLSYYSLWKSHYTCAVMHQVITLGIVMGGVYVVGSP